MIPELGPPLPSAASHVARLHSVCSLHSLAPLVYLCPLLLASSEPDPPPELAVFCACVHHHVVIDCLLCAQRCEQKTQSYSRTAAPSPRTSQSAKEQASGEGFA